MTLTPRRRAFAAALALAALSLLWGVPGVVAQTGGGYDLTWNTIAGGGATVSNGGGYELGGTIGQPATASLEGGGFSLVSGFWGGVSAATCVGDCSGDHMVTVDEILTMVNIALGNAPVSECTAGDANGDGMITVDEILTAANNALNCCP